MRESKHVLVLVVACDGHYSLDPDVLFFHAGRGELHLGVCNWADTFKQYQR